MSDLAASLSVVNAEGECRLLIPFILLTGHWFGPDTWIASFPNVVSPGHLFYLTLSDRHLMKPTSWSGPVVPQKLGPDCACVKCAMRVPVANEDIATFAIEYSDWTEQIPGWWPMIGEGCAHICAHYDCLREDIGEVLDCATCKATSRHWIPLHVP